MESPAIHDGEDFIGTSQPTVFPPGIDEEIRQIIFTINDDTVPEMDETFSLVLRVTNGDGRTVEPTVATVTIIANDDAFGIFSFVSPVMVVRYILHYIFGIVGEV